MLKRHEPKLFDEREWACMSVQAPLGTVILARKLPVLPARPTRSSGAVTDWINRRFGTNNPPGSATKRLRIRRSP